MKNKWTQNEIRLYSRLQLMSTVSQIEWLV